MQQQFTKSHHVILQGKALFSITVYRWTSVSLEGGSVYSNGYQNLQMESMGRSQQSPIHGRVQKAPIMEFMGRVQFLQRQPEVSSDTSRGLSEFREATRGFPGLRTPPGHYQKTLLVVSGEARRGSPAWIKKPPPVPYTTV